MKKFLLPILTFCVLTATAQSEIETYSVYDVNHDTSVTIDDVTKVVNHALKANADSPQTVDAAALNALLQSIDARLARIGDKLGIVPPASGTQSFTVNDVSFKMKLVEAGTFLMGTDGVYDDSNDEMPARTVTISQDYYIGETEVTQALWKAVTGYSPTSDGDSWDSSYGIGDDFPAYFISWNDCQDFITKLNALTGQNFRMPTEAEWEFAARGGNKSQGYTYSGSNNIDEVAWYGGNNGYNALPVATKAPNELGIYDMSGNVVEWCGDWYDWYDWDWDEGYCGSVVTDPTGPTSPISGDFRVNRGGGWGSAAQYCRPANRGHNDPTRRVMTLGFRLALSPAK